MKDLKKVRCAAARVGKAHRDSAEEVEKCGSVDAVTACAE